MAKKSTTANSSGRGMMILVAILVILLGVVTVKYMHSRTTVRMSRDVVDQAFVTSAKEQGMLIATTITVVPSTEAPLYKNAAELQSYIQTLAKKSNRDIVVLDKDKMVLADALVANVGEKYAADEGNEINQVMEQGDSKTFVESSADYPKGITEVVVPLKDATGAVVGAVLVSSSHLTE